MSLSLGSMKGSMALAALVVTRLLDLFGISLDAFIVVGGAVMAWMGFSVLNGQGTQATAQAEASLTPLILFAASPGIITDVITLAAAYTRLGFPITALVAVAVATSAWPIRSYELLGSRLSSPPSNLHERLRCQGTEGIVRKRINGADVDLTKHVCIRSIRILLSVQEIGVPQDRQLRLLHPDDAAELV